jgi:hypothetical protein
VEVVLLYQFTTRLTKVSLVVNCVVDIRMRGFELLGKMHIIDDTKIAKRNYELEHKAESWLSRGM